jgi:hypothetical protein
VREGRGGNGRQADEMDLRLETEDAEMVVKVLTERAARLRKDAAKDEVRAPAAAPAVSTGCLRRMRRDMSACTRESV